MRVIRPSPSGKINVISHTSLGEPAPEVKALQTGELPFLQEEVMIIEPTPLPEPSLIRIVREEDPEPPKKLTKKQRRRLQLKGE